MADKPSAEIDIDEPLVRHLLETQAAGLEGISRLPLTHVEDGWDCAIWRLGESLAVRLPRRAVAAPLMENEQRYLPAIAARLAPMHVPAPIVAGRPDPAYAWPWSVVPWYDGMPGLGVRRAERAGWAEPLARALVQLHVPAQGPFPPNPYRGGPLEGRDASIRERLTGDTGLVPDASLQVLETTWNRGLAAPPWDGPPTWIHGDLHPGNVIAQGGELVAIIDFGDLTAGDPAYDLAVAWLAFDERGRDRFRRATGDHYDQATWVRARAWAAAITLILLQQSDNNPAYRTLAKECLTQLCE